MFADDIVVIVESLQEVQDMLYSLNEASQRTGLSMILSKTKVHSV